MAITWGAFEYAGGNGMRVGLDITWSTPTSSSTTATATVDVWTENQYNYSGDSQTLTYSASLGAATSYTNNEATGTSTMRLSNRVYTYTYGASEYGTSPGYVTFSATLSGAYNGVTPTVSIASPNALAAIPARPGGIINVWNGSAWVDGTVYVCTDASPVVFTRAQARTWNGTEWKYGI